MKIDLGMELDFILSITYHSSPARSTSVSSNESYETTGGKGANLTFFHEMPATRI